MENLMQETEPPQQGYLGVLPPEILTHIGKYCNWSTRNTLSEVNLRFRLIFRPTCTAMSEMIVTRNHRFSMVMFIKADEDTRITYQYHRLRKRMVRCYSDSPDISVPVKKSIHELKGHPRTCAKRFFKAVMSHCTFDKITIKLNFLMPYCRLYQGPPVKSAVILSSQTAFDYGSYLRPINLEIVPKPYTLHNRRISVMETDDGATLPFYLDEPTFDLSKYENLEVLRIDANSTVDFKQLISSNVREYSERRGKMMVTDEDVELFKQKFCEGTTKLRRLKAGRPIVHHPENENEIKVVKIDETTTLSYSELSMELKCDSYDAVSKIDESYKYYHKYKWLPYYLRGRVKSLCCCFLPLTGELLKHQVLACFHNENLDEGMIKFAEFYY